MIEMLLRAIDEFVPDCGDDKDARFRGRLVVIVSILLSFAGLFFALHNANDDAVTRGSVISVIVGVVAAVACPFIQRQSGNIDVAAIAITTVILVTIAGTSLSGDGIYDLSIWFLILTPVVASTLINPRAGLLFAAASIIHYCLLYFITPRDVPWHPDDAARFALLTGVVVTTVLAALQFARDRGREAIRIAAREHIARLVAARAELERLTALADRARREAETREAEKAVFLDALHRRTEEQADALENARAAVAQMAVGFEELTATVNLLEENAAVTNEAAGTMTRAAGTMATDAHRVHDEVGSALKAFTDVVQTVMDASTDVGVINATAANTRAAMQAMDAALHEVHRYAQQAAEEAASTEDEARAGGEAVGETRSGIDRIQQSAAVVSEVLNELEDRVVLIGGIVRVIDDVSEQTKLLALNASITATQAGSAGRGFGVVAGEMKKLSERTSKSTSEIAALIESIQRGAALAVTSMHDGEAAIGDAVRLSAKAEDAMLRVAGATTSTAQALTAITERTTAQSDSARRVSAQVQTVASTLQDTVAQLGENARRAQELRQTGNRLGELAARASKEGDAQHENGARIEEAVAGMHHRLTLLNRAHQEQIMGNNLVLQSVEQIHDAQREQLDASEKFEHSTPLLLDAPSAEPESS